MYSWLPNKFLEEPASSTSHVLMSQKLLLWRHNMVVFLTRREWEVFKSSHAHSRVDVLYTNAHVHIHTHHSCSSISPHLYSETVREMLS